VNRLKVALAGLQAAIAASPSGSSVYTAISAEIVNLLLVLNVPDLPTSYETLTNLLTALPTTPLNDLGTPYSTVDVFHKKLLGFIARRIQSAPSRVERPTSPFTPPVG
jgi:hypothetical protein